MKGGIIIEQDVIVNEKSLKDIFGFKYTDIGEYVSNLLFYKIPVHNNYVVIGEGNEICAEIIFAYKNCITRSTINNLTMEIFFIIELKPNVNAIDYENYCKWCKIENLFDVYKVLNNFNKQYKIKNKKHLNLYDIRDLLEEIILINS